MCEVSTINELAGCLGNDAYVPVVELAPQPVGFSAVWSMTSAASTVHWSSALHEPAHQQPTQQARFKGGTDHVHGYNAHEAHRVGHWHLSTFVTMSMLRCGRLQANRDLFWWWDHGLTIPCCVVWQLDCLADEEPELC